MPYLEIIGLSARYHSLPVLEDVTFSIEKGEIVGLIGPSGSGKSTLMRVLMGLLVPTQGEVRLEGTRIDYHRKGDLRAVRDRFAIVFQQYNLFQNMTALRNVTIGPTKTKGRKAAEVNVEAQLILEKVGLGSKLQTYPDQLSGGQQQRVAIARALALKPEMLLFDEVTSALDPELVGEVLDTIRLLAHEGRTMLIVSHEMHFVREVASKVAFMANGRVLEVGAPGEVFDAPRNVRTREFVEKILGR